MYMWFDRRYWLQLQRVYMILLFEMGLVMINLDMCVNFACVELFADRRGRYRASFLDCHTVVGDKIRQPVDVCRSDVVYWMWHLALSRNDVLSIPCMRSLSRDPRVLITSRVVSMPLPKWPLFLLWPETMCTYQIISQPSSIKQTSHYLLNVLCFIFVKNVNMCVI